MGNKINDLSGQKVGMLLVIEPCGKTKGGNIKWLCRCDCGNTTIVNGGNLKQANTKSCGCLRKRRASEQHLTHGLSNSRLFDIWHGMKSRCNNPKHKMYHYYGGRGITVCDEWKTDFQKFYDWAMANGYKDDLSIDRIDNDKGDSPDNCRWATTKEQNRNTGQNIYITLGRDTKTLAEWCEEYNIKYRIAYDRLRSNWTIEEALELVPRKKT